MCPKPTQSLVQYEYPALIDNIYFMGSLKKIDLLEAIQDPSGARQFIKHFDWQGLPGIATPDSITLDNGKIIEFKNMSDDEALLVASIIFHELHIPRAIKELAFEKWTH